jgi:arylsulfatase A-like enzyme
MLASTRTARIIQKPTRMISMANNLERIVTLAFSACLVVIPQLVCSAPLRAESSDRPNIVLIMADDMGWSDLGCYGGEIPTPHIDSIASEGLRFTQFYNNAVCGPTRASLLTGLYCQQVGHSGRHWNQPKDFSRCVLIPEVLHANGYHTMMVGKWQGRDLAVDRGFNRFFGPNCQAKISYFHEVHGNDFYLDEKRWHFPEQGFFMTDAFNDHADDFLQEAVTGDDPFFLYLAYIAPHWPLHAREEYIAPHRDRYRQQGWTQWRETRLRRQKEMKLISEETQLAPVNPAIGKWDDDPNQHWQAERMAVYSAQISRIDHGVGRLLATLKKSGKEDNTLIMFLSDNGAAPDGGVRPATSGLGFDGSGKGPAFRRDGVIPRGGSGPNNMPGSSETFAGYGIAWATTSNTPLRSTKLTAYEGGIRTPLIVRWPSVIHEGGQITSQPGHVIDLMATCLDVAGIDYPSNGDSSERNPLPLEGKSLAKVFEGEQRQGHDALFFSVPRNQALRMGRWKIVNARRGAPWELYDIGRDPTETTNLAKDHPQRVEQMAATFKQWQQRVGDN